MPLCYFDMSAVMLCSTHTKSLAAKKEQECQDIFLNSRLFVISVFYIWTFFRGAQKAVKQKLGFLKINFASCHSRISSCRCLKTKLPGWPTSAPARRSTATTASPKSGAAPGTPTTLASSSSELNGECERRRSAVAELLGCLNSKSFEAKNS